MIIRNDVYDLVTKMACCYLWWYLGQKGETVPVLYLHLYAPRILWYYVVSLSRIKQVDCLNLKEIEIEFFLVSVIFTVSRCVRESIGAHSVFY
jgi:hypothetical protein